jgi:DNA repair protein RecO (recombination protein O)
LIGYASYAIELIDRSTAYDEENRELYNLLIQTLSRLNAGDNPRRVSRYFEIRLLDLIGFRPQLKKCARCVSEIQAEDQYFSAEFGGALCPKCGHGDPNVKPISMSALKFFRHFQRSSYKEVARVTIKSVIYSEMENIMQYYITHCLERGLNSPAFIRHVRSTEQ